MSRKQTALEYDIKEVMTGKNIPYSKVKGRRLEIATIGCQLHCFSREDLEYVLDDSNDLEDVEHFFTKRKLA